MSTPEAQHWCYYIGDDGDERVTLYGSEDEAHGEAEDEIDRNHDAGEAITYTVAPMLSALDVLRTRIRAERIGEQIAEMIDEWVADDMACEEPPLDLPKALHAKLGQMVAEFFDTNAVSQWWTVDTKRKTLHTYVAGSNDDAQGPKA